MDNNNGIPASLRKRPAKSTDINANTDFASNTGKSADLPRNGQSQCCNGNEESGSNGSLRANSPEDPPGRHHEPANGTKLQREKDNHTEDLTSVLRIILDGAEPPRDFTAWNSERQHRWISEAGKNASLDLPERMAYIIPALLLPGDCGRFSSEKPEWLDAEKFRRGQKFALDHFFGLCFENMLSLFLLFAIEDTLRPMIFSGKSHTPYLAYTRYLSTVHRIRNWYRDDPSAKGTRAYNDLQAVRQMHRVIRRRLCEHTEEEIVAATTIPNAWCPMLDVYLKDFAAACPADNVVHEILKKLNAAGAKPKGFNQFEMVMTQFAFMGLIVLYPEEFGVHGASVEDLEAFCHVWKGIGYFLGVEDQYNFCRGSLQEIRQRCHDHVEIIMKPMLRQATPEWEHMTRCLVVGINTYCPGVSHVTGMLYIAELLKIDMPLHNSVAGLGARLFHVFSKFLLYYLIRIPGVEYFLNTLVHMALNNSANLPPKAHERLQKESDMLVQDFRAEKH